MIKSNFKNTAEAERTHTQIISKIYRLVVDGKRLLRYNPYSESLSAERGELLRSRRIKSWFSKVDTTLKFYFEESDSNIYSEFEILYEELNIQKSLSDGQKVKAYLHFLNAILEILSEENL